MHRYEARFDREGRWVVYDAITDEPAYLNDELCVGETMDDAGLMATLLNYIAAKMARETLH